MGAAPPRPSRLPSRPPSRPPSRAARRAARRGRSAPCPWNHLPPPADCQPLCAESPLHKLGASFASRPPAARRSAARRIARRRIAARAPVARRQAEPATTPPEQLPAAKLPDEPAAVDAAALASRRGALRPPPIERPRRRPQSASPPTRRRANCLCTVPRTCWVLRELMLTQALTLSPRWPCATVLELVLSINVNTYTWKAGGAQTPWSLYCLDRGGAMV